MSDIHFEFGRGFDLNQRYVPPEADVTVLAGDISTGVAGIMWAQETFDRPVIYVPGNHEYYGKRIYAEHLERMRAKAAGSNVHLLNNNCIEISDRVFIGATLWTDYNLYRTQPLAMLQAASQINDYRAIFKGMRDPVTPAYLLEQHIESRDFIEKNLKVFGRNAIVVTHHAPSELSTRKTYAGDALNHCYASSLEELMLAYVPSAWMHGHVHESFDYEIGATRVMCNPRGYVGHELNPEFNPHLVVDV